MYYGDLTDPYYVFTYGDSIIYNGSELEIVNGTELYFEYAHVGASVTIPANKYFFSKFSEYY